ncbi:peptidyl-glycine alpha-amidating monooxygenase [Plakobranchus ocellatus]|uniref:peptidylamidoglycolate lyase n=1 Tax=Plakobranchus ocellatus TaxID=259542 RepID=A0AAV3YDI7_9GAST|nr:peptidyl-glycine alpha-amidating monooxygenase [Plakobranchus ocellatus]
MWPLLLVSCLVWVNPATLAAPQYFDLDTWTPQQMAAFLGQYRQARVASPEEDINFNTDSLGLGDVSAVDVDSEGDLFIFHRAGRSWTSETFNNNVLSQSAQVPIVSNTILKVSPDNARLISTFGNNFFNMPHGLKVDSNDNLWVTDVGRHQVFRFPKNSTTPDLVLGEKFVPGSDSAHFCKPTDVAIASSGEFFVADGYCNSRILKFSKDGQFLTQWGNPYAGGRLTPFNFRIPHSVTLIENLNLLCVADRENQRALCYNAGLSNNAERAGTFNRTLIPEGDMGKVFAIYYNSADNTVVAASETSRVPYVQAGLIHYPARAYTYSITGVQTDVWARMTPQTARRGPSLIHDLCASHDGRHFFLADLPQQRVLRYTMTERPFFLQGYK